MHRIIERKNMGTKIKKNISEQEEAQIVQAEKLKMLGDAYEAKLEVDMEKMHNQFVGFISVAKLPLPQVLLVLQMLVQETIEQAYKKYLGD